MKKIYGIILLFSISITSCASSGGFNAYLKKEDKFNPGVKTYFSEKIQITKSSPFTVTKGEFSIFHSGDEASGNWYIETTYASEKWLFVRALKFNIDGNIYTFNSAPNPIRDVGYIFSDLIREVNRFHIDKEFIRTLSKSDAIHIRLSGSNYYHERELNSDEIKNMALPLIEWVTFTGLLPQDRGPVLQGESKWHSQSALYCENRDCVF